MGDYIRPLGVNVLLEHLGYITKTCLFKYIENFTTKKMKLSDEKF